MVGCHSGKDIVKPENTGPNINPAQNKNKDVKIEHTISFIVSAHKVKWVVVQIAEVFHVRPRYPVLAFAHVPPR